MVGRVVANRVILLYVPIPQIENMKMNPAPCKLWLSKGLMLLPKDDFSLELKFAIDEGSRFNIAFSIYELDIAE